MGRTRIPKYRLIMDDRTTLTWDGKVSDRLLENYVIAYAKSLEHGGANFHISESLGYVPYPDEARVETNEQHPTVVARWKAASFQTFTAFDDDKRTRSTR